MGNRIGTAHKRLGSNMQFLLGGGGSTYDDLEARKRLEL